VGIGIFPNLMNLQFYPDQTAAPTSRPNTALSGDAHASFLLGTLDQRTTARGFPFQTQRVPFLGAFVHDDWKITRRVTLTSESAGSESAPYDDHDTYSRFLDLSVPNQAMRQTPPVIPPISLRFPGPPSTEPGISPATILEPFPTPKNIFLPRIGAAIRVNEKRPSTSASPATWCRR
jgi:hypothetical protein